MRATEAGAAARDRRTRIGTPPPTPAQPGVPRVAPIFVALALGLGFAATPALGHGDAPKPEAAAKAKPEQQDWGIAGEAKAARRTVEISMSDAMRFTPDHIKVRRGETVKFVFRNQGRQLHEFVLGTRQALQEHAALMVKFPKMEHDELYMVHVAPGKTGRLVWTFNRPGEFDFACLIPGHYQAGMVGKISVAAP